MAYTQEPKGLVWINNTNVNAVGALTTNACWFIGSVSLTAVACITLLRKDPNGLTLAGFLLAAWGGKSVAGVVDSNNKRKADPAYAPVVEATERGRVAGAAAATVLAEQAEIRALTVRPAPTNGAPAATAEVTVNTGSGAPPAVKLEAEPNAFTDDERGSG